VKYEGGHCEPGLGVVMYPAHGMDIFTPTRTSRVQSEIMRGTANASVVSEQ
jgi:hypothetical protein